MAKNKFLNEKNSIFFILFITAIVLLSPCILRLINNNSALIGDKSYYHARIAEQISEQKIPEIDELSYQGRAYIFNPYHLVLSWFGFITDVETASQVLIFLSGLISVFLFFLLLKEIKINILQRSLILFVLVLSPAFIYTFSVSNKHSISIPLLLIGLYFLLKRKFYFSAFFLIVSSFLSLFNIAIVLIILLGAFFRKRDKKMLFIISIILIIFLIYYVPFYYSYGLPEKVQFIHINHLQKFISGIGSVIGFSIFALILAIMGIAVTWKMKKELIFVYFAVVFLLSVSSYSINSNIYLNFFISIFAGLGFYSIIKRKWEVKLIMDLTILVLLCGLLFSSVSYINRLGSMQPDDNIRKSLEWLNEYSDPEEVVLSHYSKGAFIEYWAERPVVMDSLFEYAPDLNERYNDSVVIFNSRNLKETKNLLEKYSIKYIGIDHEMKKGLVWKEEKQGLLFLFRNKETFKNIYSKNNIDIWEVKTQE